MAFARTRIQEARLLLEAPQEKLEQNMCDARRLARSMKYYYLSPVFLMSGGHGLRSRLEEKYGIDNRFACCDILMNLITAPFCDELFVMSGILIGVTFMCLFWLPTWQKSAFDRGYNRIHGSDPYGGVTAFDYACDGSDHNSCASCNQAVYCDSSCQIGPIGGCNDRAPVYCPLIESTGINAVLNATALQKNMYVDPNSFVNDTYLTYMSFGGSWSVLVCNRTTEGFYQGDWAKTYWILSFTSIIIGSVVFLLLLSQIFWYCHSSADTYDPEKYRLIRKDDYERLIHPITQPIIQPIIADLPPSYNSIN